MALIAHLRVRKYTLDKSKVFGGFTLNGHPCYMDYLDYLYTPFYVDASVKFCHQFQKIRGLDIIVIHMYIAPGGGRLT